MWKDDCHGAGIIELSLRPMDELLLEPISCHCAGTKS